MILMILRHGKAEKDSPTGKDADRPLAERGERQAEYIGTLLVKAKSGKNTDGLAAPKVILSSKAERARTTAQIVADALGMRVTLDDALRLGNPAKDAMALVRKMAKRDEPVLIVGHNPQLEELVGSLAGKENELRTGEFVCFDAQVSGKKVTARELLRERLGGD